MHPATPEMQQNKGKEETVTSNFDTTYTPSFHHLGMLTPRYMMIESMADGGVRSLISFPRYNPQFWRLVYEPILIIVDSISNNIRKWFQHVSTLSSTSHSLCETKQINPMFHRGISITVWPLTIQDTVAQDQLIKRTTTQLQSLYPQDLPIASPWMWLTSPFFC